MSIEDGIPSSPSITTKGWTLDGLIAQSHNFVPVERVSFNSPNLLSVIQESEENGTPLVIQGFHLHDKWPKNMFTLENFLDNSNITVRNVHNWTDTSIPMTDFIAQFRRISIFSEVGEQIRYYGKDAECPRAWEDWLQNSTVIPSKFLPGGSDDLLHSDSDSVSIETLMCYLGIGDTFTPCHKDLCASSGQNLMCYTENDGASFWFMTKSGDAGKVDSYFSNKLGQDLDHENHVVTTKELAKGDFTVYVVEQKLGDLVLVPPRSCHQVVNYGGITVKTSWSRMTLEGLETALYYELPMYQRFETYRVKATVHRTLLEDVSSLELMVSGQAHLVQEHSSGSSQNKQKQFLLHRTSQLLRVYSNILTEEYCSAFKTSTMEASQDNRLVCDFCGCDVFQSFFECQDRCFETDADDLKQYCILCAGCFAEGRTCACGDMKPMQRYDFSALLDLRSRAIQLLENTSTSHSFEIQFSKAIKDSESPRTFKAACALYRLKSHTLEVQCNAQTDAVENANTVSEEPNLDNLQDAEISCNKTVEHTDDQDATVVSEPSVEMLVDVDAGNAVWTAKKRKYMVYVDVPPLPYRIRTQDKSDASMLPLVHTPKRSKTDRTTIVAKSGLRARRSFVEDSPTNSNASPDHEYLRSSYIAEAAVDENTPTASSSYSARLAKVGKIKRYDDPKLASSGSIQASTSTSSTTSSHTTYYRPENSYLDDRHLARLHMHQHHRQQRQYELDRAEIYKKIKPPKGSGFYFQNGEKKYGVPPEEMHQTAFTHSTNQVSQSSSSRGTRHKPTHSG
ncbi:hypothetical protein CVT24_005947 [Panaeolus cyanescens]|uniref:JmjC domain-containing protein n=1 Tax=Panaeolus cyanescens TaxID=181874 RepID=A0A409V8Z7_9AGAR|nr:hypothetical protein CVT24_005947 [Panaeolus cyanescens]